MAPEETSRIRTKHGELSLEQLAEMQPGMARIMDEYGRRFWAMYYAAKAGNWDLARYMHSEMLKLGNVAVVVRPKYAEALRKFEGEHLAPLGEAIRKRDAAAFEARYRETLAASDEYHDRFHKGFIRFRLPDHPPDWLRMEP